MTGTKGLVRILHTCDIHLHDILAGQSRLDDLAHRALTAMVDLGIQTKADLILIAGDLFDYNGVSTQAVEFVLEQLDRLQVPALILPGNHDCLITESVYLREQFSTNNGNICIFKNAEGEIYSFEELDLAVWGKPIMSFSGMLHPLEDIPPRGNERWQIAMAHGFYIEGEYEWEHSHPITKVEIIQSARDYIALGHLGASRCICTSPTMACYAAGSAFGTVNIVDLIDGIGAQVQTAQLWQ